MNCALFEKEEEDLNAEKSRDCYFYVYAINTYCFNRRRHTGGRSANNERCEKKHVTLIDEEEKKSMLKSIQIAT